MINFLFGTNGKSIILGVPTLKHITSYVYITLIPDKRSAKTETADQHFTVYARGHLCGYPCYLYFQNVYTSVHLHVLDRIRPRGYKTFHAQLN